MRTCAACGQANPGGARFCNACGDALGDAAKAREERKVVTVVFADLVGSTSRAELLDPEDVQAILRPFHSRLRHELERYGGTVEKFIGDAVVAIFGAPTAHDDDPERAVRAAIAIQEAIGELNDADPELALEVRIGINTGEALVALDARPELGEGMVSGDVINTGARLQSGAPAGGILVGEQTRRAVERAIELAEHPPLEAKGKTRPVPCWQVVGRRASFGLEDDAVGHAPLVGRRREVALLVDALARVRTEERPQLVTLVGVPGIGKSRLVQELRQVVEHDPELIVWRRGRSLPYGEGVAYWALGEIVKAQAGILESDDAETASGKLSSAVASLVPRGNETAWLERQLGPLVGLPGRDDAPARDESFAAWRRFLEALADNGPAVLVFEDVHWADDDLLDFVDELADELDAVPLLLVCTARPELLSRRPGWGGGKLNAVTLSLGRLSDEETAQLVAGVLERSVLPAETQAALLSRAEGVPLFAEEYARMLATGDARDTVPETLQGLVAARIDGLPDDAKELLQDAAVLGKVFWTDALAALGEREPSELEAGLRVLERREFVRRERRSVVEGARQYVFLHAVVRDVASGQLPRAARAVRHRATAQWIVSLPEDRGEDRAETLVHHLESALSYGEAAGVDVGQLRPLLARALRDAGDRAQALGLVGRAASYYERALEADERDPPDPELLFALARARSAAADDGVIDFLRTTSESLLAMGRKDLAAWCLTLLSRTLWFYARDEEELLERALALVAAMGRTTVRGRVLAAVAANWSLTGRGDEALPLAREALAIAEALGDRDAEAEALNTLGMVLLNRGELAAAVEAQRRGLELAVEIAASDGPRLYTNLAATEHALGWIAAATEHLRAGLALSKRVGNQRAVRWQSAELALESFELGAWDEAVDDAKRLLAESDGGSGHYLDAQLMLAVARVTHAREGRLEVAGIFDALDEARRIADHQMVVPVLTRSALLFAEAGMVADAERCLVEYRSEIAGDSSWADECTPYAVIVWLRVMTIAVPDELVRGPDVPWTEAAVAAREGRAAAGADLMGSIGMKVLEAELRLLATDQLALLDPVEAARQLDLAADFWRSVAATARLTTLEPLRSKIRAAAS